MLKFTVFALSYRDLNYIFALLSYPLLILLSYDLGDISLLCSAGAFTILVNVPCSYLYIKNHNETLTRINTRYCKEKILNTTYNPTYNQIPTRETTVQPGNYEILEMA